MSISMERFDSSGRFATYDPGASDGPAALTSALHCRDCGYQADDPLCGPRVCPRCLGSSFERLPVPGCLLAVLAGAPPGRLNVRISARPAVATATFPAGQRRHAPA